MKSLPRSQFPPSHISSSMISASISSLTSSRPGVAGDPVSPMSPSHRPCAMVVPDFELICEIMLVAEGFIEARLLARKFISLYQLCRELLSKQVTLPGYTRWPLKCDCPRSGWVLELRYQGDIAPSHNRFFIVWATYQTSLYERICLQCRRPWFNSWVGKIHWRRDTLPTPAFLDFPCGSAGKESSCNMGDLGLIPGLGRIPWRRERLPTSVFWPGEFHGLHSPQGCKKSDTTEWLSVFQFRNR